MFDTTILAKFHALSYWLRKYCFWGELSLYMVWCIFSTQLDPTFLSWSTLVLTTARINSKVKNISWLRSYILHM